MKFPIESYAGAGVLKLGMSRPEVRRLLGEGLAHKRSGIEDCDLFADRGCQIYYGGDGRCEAIEFMPPAQVTWAGQAMLERPYSEVRDWLKTKDASLVEEEAGLTSEALGFGLFASAARKAPDEPVESVIVFRKGYYSGLPDLVEELRKRVAPLP